MIELIIFSFFAGVLTVLAPCILPLIPVIIGASASSTGPNGTSSDSTSLRRPLTIICSLIVSIVLFSLLLKSSTILLGVPASVWSIISGGIILLFGVNMLFPMLWDAFMARTQLQLRAQSGMQSANKRSGLTKDIILGAALGPIFNSCSPTYALIVAVLLPVSFASGLLYLSAYSIGLGLALLLFAIFGRSIVAKIAWMSNPHGAFQRILGIIFIVIGILILFGVEKDIQAAILDSGAYGPIESIERSFFGD